MSKPPQQSKHKHKHKKNMANVNKVMLMGNVTREIELRHTPKGNAVTDIRLAVNRTSTQDGEKKEETVFVDVTLWGRVAEVAKQYSGKGQPLFVEGRLHMDEWEDKSTGQKRTKLKVIGENIQLLGGGKSQQTPEAPSSPKPSTTGEGSTETNDDIPF